MLAVMYRVHISRSARSIDIPQIDLTGIDPAVADAIGQAGLEVRSSPSDAARWGRLGMLLLIHEFKGDAIACFDEAQRLDATNPRWPHLQGMSLMKDRPIEAVAQFRRAAELCDDRPPVSRLRMGQVLFETGHFEEARAAFDRAISRDPTNPYAALGMAQLETAQGHLDAAAQWLTGALSDARTQKRAAVLLASVEARRGDTNAAAHDSRDAAALPDDLPMDDPIYEQAVDLHVGRVADIDRAGVLLDDGKIAEAVEMLRGTTARYPDSEIAWKVLGRALLAANDLSSAEAALRRALQLSPASTSIYDSLGRTLLRQNRLEEAVRSFRTSIRLNADNAGAHYNLGDALDRMGQSAEAVQELRAAIRLQPSISQAQKRLNEVLAKSPVTTEPARDD